MNWIFFSYSPPVPSVNHSTSGLCAYFQNYLLYTEVCLANRKFACYIAVKPNGLTTILRKVLQRIKNFDEPSPVTTPCPLKLRLGLSLVRSICLKSSTPFLKVTFISPCLPSSVKFCMTSARSEGGEREKASKSGKNLRMLSTTFWDLSLGRPWALKTCVR